MPDQIQTLWFYCFNSHEKKISFGLIRKKIELHKVNELELDSSN